MQTARTSIAYLFLSALPLLAFAQTQPVNSPNYAMLTHIPVETKFIVTDQLQQIYAVTPNNTIIKFVPKGTSDYQEQYRFSNNTLGELDHLDATDPFNLLLYYPDYQTIITLDRTLNQTGSFNLIAAGVVQARTAALSNDGYIWVYDEAAFQLRQLNRTGKALLESQQLSLLLPQAPQAHQLTARENLVYLSDPQLGILVFNNFGQYLKLIPLQNIAKFQILDKLLIYKRGNTLELYNLITSQHSVMSLPTGLNESDQVQVQQGRLFVQKKDRIEIYSF
ncbi:MAG: hypothetical protein ACK4TA_18085 [Saprospiraceae bacterium]